MRLSFEHDPKYLRLGLILVFTGFLVALLLVTQIHAADLYDLSQDTPFLISSDYDSSVFGYRVGSGSTSWIREEFGLLYANLNDNNNVSSFTDQITYQVTTSDSWSDSYAVKRGGFNASNFGIVSGSLLTPENGFIFDNSVEEFHLSKNQWVRVFQCPRQFNYGISQGYYQIYFYDVHQSFMNNSGVDAGRHPVICFCIPQEHYNDFCLITDGFDYPYQDYKVFYYDYSLGGGQWVGVLPNPFSFEDSYTLAYSDRSVQLRANGNRVKIESMKFADQVPSPTPTVSPSPAPSPDTYYFKFSASDYYGTYYYMVSFNASELGLSCSFPANDSFISYIANQESFDPSDFSGSGFVYRSGMSSTWNQPTYEKPALAFYFTSSGYSNFKLYSIPNSTAYDYDPEIIVQNYTPTDVGSSGYVRTYDYSYSGLSCFLFSQELRGNNNYRLDSYVLGSVYGFDYTYQNVYSTASWLSDGSYYNLSSGYQNKVNFAYYGFLGLLGKFLDVDNPNGPSPTPSPSPSPTVSPIPTDPPYVVIVTPVPEASPTPPIQIVTSGPMPSWFPPGDPLIPLDPEIQDDVFGDFSGKVSNNSAFGFLGILMALIPSEAVWFLWFLLFVLIVLGIAKVIIHFTGG